MWKESDIDIVRITKGKSRPCYWKWIEGIRVEITEISLEDWMKKKRKIDFEQTEAYLASLNATRVVYDPKGIVKKKLQKFQYSTEMKLFLILRGLANAIRYIKSTKKCLTLKKDYSCYENLRQAIINLAASLFALNKEVRDILEIENIGKIHYWLDEFESLKRKPQNFSRIYKIVLSWEVSKENQIQICNQLWQIFEDVLKFCEKDIKRDVKKLGGMEKVKKELKLDNLQLEVLRKVIGQSKPVSTF